MGTGYTRQSTADIITGANITAAPLNNEFNAIQAAFSSSTGHTHDGTSGEGPLINLTTSITGILPIANGGTGANTASAARTSLGLAIGTNVQAYDAGLQSISGLTTSANQLIYTTGSDTYATTRLTAAGRALLDDASASNQLTTLGVSAFGKTLIDDANAVTARSTLGLTIGTNVQAYDAGLQSIAGLTTSANQLIYTTGSDTYATTRLTAAGRALLDDASASNQLTTLGVSAFGKTLIDDANAATARTTLGVYSTSEVDSAITSASESASSILTKLLTVDGSGSGLDADLLDGVQGSNYARTDIAETFSNDVTISGDLIVSRSQLIGGIGAEATSGVLNWNDISNARSGNGYSLLFGNATNGPGPARYFHPFSFEYSSKNGTGNLTQFAIPYYQGGADDAIFYRTRSSGTWSSWVELWSSANDGSGSGLDADTVDGIQGASLVRTSRTVSAGTGLTGGGNLSANRTISANIATQAEAEAGTSSTKLMTPKRVAQAIDAQAPVGLYTGTTASETNYPIGHTLITSNISDGNTYAINATKTIYFFPNSGNNNLFLTYTSTGTVALSGTWRCRGQISGPNTIWQRVA